MSYKLESKPTSNSSSRLFYGHKTTPTGITIHHWGQDGQNHASVVGWLRGKAGGTANTGSSAHYVVSGGLVTKLADEKRATWHAGNRKGNGATIGIEMRPEMSDADWQTLVELCADIERRFGSMRYYRHKDWKATACPGRYSDLVGKLVNDVNAHLAGNSTPAPKPTKPKPAPQQKKKTVSQMASEVIAGKHGSGHTARQHSLGVNASTYAKVRAEVNRRAGVSAPKASTNSISRMATEVIAGKHGSGHANRQKSLGVNAATYQKVRAEVNKRAGGGTSKPVGKSVSQMATEVLRGNHGNGHAARQRSLGVNNATYAKVRAEVNRRS